MYYFDQVAGSTLIITTLLSCSQWRKAAAAGQSHRGTTANHKESTSRHRAAPQTYQCRCKTQQHSQFPDTLLYNVPSHDTTWRHATTFRHMTQLDDTLQRSVTWHNLMTHYNILSHGTHNLMTHYNILSHDTHNLMTRCNVLSHDTHNLMTRYNVMSHDTHNLMTHTNQCNAWADCVTSHGTKQGDNVPSCPHVWGRRTHDGTVQHDTYKTIFISRHLSRVSKSRPYDIGVFLGCCTRLCNHRAIRNSRLPSLAF